MKHTIALKKRMLSVFFLLCFLMGTLFLRFYSLAASEALAAAANRQGTKTLTVTTTRGQIYDHRFTPLVNTEKSTIAAVLPSPSSADLLLDAVPVLDRAAVLTRLQAGEPFTAVLANRLPSDTTELQTFVTTKRYADNQLAPHIIGHLTNGGTEGGYGIEKAYDTFLKEHTTQTTITYFLDAKGGSIQGREPAISAPAASDAGVVLTLDRELQQIIEEVGKQQIDKGAIVVMTPDGKIRGCASFPAFSPTNLSDSLKDEANQPMFNRTFGSYAVGSTFKIATAATALESGISPTLSYFCSGQIAVKEQVFGCHKHTGHGKLTLSQAMAESCNPYFISLGLSLDRTKLLQTARDLSFSKRYELAPGFYTQAGYLPTADELFNPAEVANLSFGQGKLMATPIQIATMTCAILNGGKTPTPKLVEGLTLDGSTLSEAYPTAAPTDAMKEETAAQLQEFLIASVMDKANQEAKPTKTTAGGKTATAQTGNYNGDEEVMQGWFTGFFPAENPQYVVTVLCEDAESGNATAGPVFREIADRITEEILQKEKT